MEVKGQVDDVGSDFKIKTLEWAASMVDCKPSPRLEFIKQYIEMFTSDELSRLKKMVQNTKRRVVKNEGKAKKFKTDQPTLPLPLDTEAATSSFQDAANSSGEGGSGVDTEPQQPWWIDYEDEDIIAWDSEYVSCPTPGGGNKNRTATLDVVNTESESIKSFRVFHKKGSFNVTRFSKIISGFASDTFDKMELPNLDQVKKEMDEFFKGKLLVTCGGIHDYNGLGLNMGDYDVFDLQSHWFRTKFNEYGAEIREPHSLRSLVKYYLKEDTQTETHTSLEDAVNTMKLFDVYKRIRSYKMIQNMQTKDLTSQGHMMK